MGTKKEGMKVTEGAEYVLTEVYERPVRAGEEKLRDDMELLEENEDPPARPPDLAASAGDTVPKASAAARPQMAADFTTFCVIDDQN